MRADRALRVMLRVLLSAALTLIAAASAAAAPNGGVGYRVDGEPGSTIDGGFITLKVGAGGNASGHFYATNTGNTDAQLSVYSADGLTGNTTGIVYSGAGEAKSDAGRWLSPSTRGILLRADDARRVDFSLHVPSGTTPGDHVGGIVLEQRRTGGAIQQVVRNVVPVLVDVSGTAGSSLDLRSAMVTDLPGTTLPAVTVKMRNDGRRICRPSISVSLTGPGERGTPVVKQLDAILPGDDVPFPLPWPRELERGTYTAFVTASGCGAPTTMRTDVRSDVTAESSKPSGSSGGGDEVVTAVPPGQPQYFAPSASSRRDRSGAKSERGDGDVPASTAGAMPSGTPPTGASGSASAGGDGGGVSGIPGFGKLSELGDVAIEYLPPLLERLIAPLSLLGLMLLFLFAQEAFDRKDPKLALAPISRDPDLQFTPLDDDEFGGPLPTPGFELVPPPGPPRPTPT
jgi:hypothetical protein